MNQSCWADRRSTIMRIAAVVIVISLFVAVATLTLSVVSKSTPTAESFRPGYGLGDPSECSRLISYGSIEAAAGALPSGGVLCARAGIYTESDQRLSIESSGTVNAPKTIKAYPGERVELRAAIRGSASHWVIEGLFIDASYALSGPAPGGRINTDQGIAWTGGTNIRFDSLEIVNRRPNRKPGLAGTCVFFGGTSRPSDIVLEDSSIHQCGQLPRSNREHCIYAAKVTRLTLRNNWIYDCSDRSIQLYPDADSSLIVGNLIDSDSQTGILLDKLAHYDTIRNNVVDTPNGRTISTGNSYAGSGSAVLNNCVWDTAVELAPDTLSRGNIVADPQISGFTVTSHACAAKLPTDNPFRPSALDWPDRKVLPGQILTGHLGLLQSAILVPVRSARLSTRKLGRPG